MGSRSRVLLLVAGVACLLSAPVALADRVAWSETARVDRAAVMRYEVTSITIGKSRWSAHVSFRNLSHKTIKVGNRFGISFYGDSTTESLADALGFALATKFSTTPPKSLKPGASWTGVISGSGSLSVSGPVYARVVFGPFSGLPGETGSVVWITDHAKVVDVAKSSTGPLGPSI